MTDRTQTQVKGRSGNPALTRLHNRESVRLLALVQTLTFEQIRRSDIWELEKLWRDHNGRKTIYQIDQLLTVAEELETKSVQPDFEEVDRDGAGESNDG
jgi:hypothetical protein